MLLWSIGSRVKRQPQVLRLAALAQDDNSSGLSNLQMVDFSQKLFGLRLQLRALYFKIFLRILARLELEVEVAQVLIQLLLALQQEIEARLGALAGV